MQYVLINLSAVFLTESFFFSSFLFFFLGAECPTVDCVREGKGEKEKLYLYGNFLVNYSPSLTVLEERLREARRLQGAIRRLSEISQQGLLASRSRLRVNTERRGEERRVRRG